MGVPPAAAVYHRYCPLLPPVALSITVDEGAQEDPVVPTGGEGNKFIAAVAKVRVLSQIPLLRAT